MKRAAVSLLALAALCVPTVLQAQEDTLTASATKVLQGFGLILSHHVILHNRARSRTARRS